MAREGGRPSGHNNRTANPICLQLFHDFFYLFIRLPHFLIADGKILVVMVPVIAVKPGQADSRKLSRKTAQCLQFFYGNSCPVHSHIHVNQSIHPYLFPFACFRKATQLPCVITDGIKMAIGICLRQLYIPPNIGPYQGISQNDLLCPCLCHHFRFCHRGSFKFRYPVFHLKLYQIQRFMTLNVGPQALGRARFFDGLLNVFSNDIYIIDQAGRNNFFRLL